MFPLFLFIDLNFLIIAVIEHIFNPTAELVIPTGKSIKEAKVEVEAHSVTAEAIITKCSI